MALPGCTCKHVIYFDFDRKWCWRLIRGEGSCQIARVFSRDVQVKTTHSTVKVGYEKQVIDNNTR